MVAYLYEAVGASGDNGCRPSGVGYPSRSGNTSQLTLNHVFQSHPHKDHGAMIDEVLDCYQVANLWDSGAMNNTNFYRDLLDEADGETGLTYHTASAPPANRSITVKGRTMTFPVGTWEQFSEEDEVELDADASFTILHAEGTSRFRIPGAADDLAISIGRRKNHCAIFLRS